MKIKRKEESEEIQYIEQIEKTVKAYGNGANVTVPKKWIGKRVKVLLIED